MPALLAEGEVYLSDAFRDLQAAPPKIVGGVSVQGSVLDLEVDTGEFPVSELKALLKSLHQKSATTACGMADCCGWMTRWKCWMN